MPSRTYLTAPPGQDPSPETGRSATQPRERYVPGLRRPVEPEVPSRLRTPVVVTAVVIALVGTLVLMMRLSAESQAQDPSLLDPNPPGVPADDGEGATLRDSDTGGLPGDG